MFKNFTEKSITMFFLLYITYNDDKTQDQKINITIQRYRLFFIYNYIQQKTIAAKIVKPKDLLSIKFI